MVDLIIDNNISMSAMGVYLVTRPAIPVAKRKDIIINVPGRNGNLTKFDGYDDREITINLNFIDFGNVAKKAREIKAILLNAKTFMLSDDYEVKYRIKKTSLYDNIQRELSVKGSIVVTFTIEPFDYEADDELIVITNKRSIHNLGSYYSEPIIKLYGSGNLQFSIGNKTYQVNEVSSVVSIDSELMLCYEETNNKRITGGFPVLEVGENEIILRSNISKMEIVKRTRWL